MPTKKHLKSITNYKTKKRQPIKSNTDKHGPDFLKVNINNELTKNRMTIKVFFKFLRILNIKKVKFSITVVTERDFEVTVDEEISLFTTDFKDDNE
jgi:hypothetical protein